MRLTVYICYQVKLAKTWQIFDFAASLETCVLIKDSTETARDESKSARNVSILSNLYLANNFLKMAKTMKLLASKLLCSKDKKNKNTSKIISAKKVLRKKIKVNSKVKFDEDGEVCILC